MKTILVYLQHEIPAFNLQTDSLKKFQLKYSTYNFIIANTFNEFKQHLSQAHFILTWHFKKELYSHAKKLKAIFTPAAGNDWVDPDPKKKIYVHYGSFHGQMVFESFFSMMMSFTQQHSRNIENKKNKLWAREKISTKKLLRNQIILIIGYGHIGKKIALNLEIFGCTVYGFKRTLSKNKQEKTTIINNKQQLQTCLQSANHVLLLLPKTSSTTHFFCRQYFMAMNKTAILYNFGRGNCIKHNDILWALKNNIIAGVGLDVFEKEPLPKHDPLWSLDNAFITPHSSCFYEEYMTLFISELIDIWPSYASL